MGILPPRLTSFFTATLLLVGAASLFVFGPPDCPFWLVGVPCPGCGLTRATVAAGHGEFEAAFRYNPFVVYYWLLGLLLSLGFVLHALGAETRPEAFAARTAFRVPPPLHATIFVSGWAYNLWNLGINPEGYVPSAIRWLEARL